MKIVRADAEDYETVKRIAQTTIREVYPHYYPAGAVEFFCAYHSDDRIRKDVSRGMVYLLNDNEETVGTVTVKENEINRLFVLPQFQHKGYGRALLDFAEKLILKRYTAVQVDASLPAKQIYQKRGYRETEYHMIRTETGDYLCYDVMKLTKQERNEEI